MRESSVEAYLTREVKRMKGMSVKLKGSLAGLPDRMLLLPGSRLYFVELKTDVGVRSARQVLLHSMFAKLGFHVYTLSGINEVKRFIDVVLTKDLPAEGV